MTIKFYKTNEPYGFLNNFVRTRMFIYGRWWNWVEAPFQAAKTFIKEEQDIIWLAERPKIARDLGQKVTLRPDWEQVKRSIMKECVMAKFLQHADLRSQLISTQNEEIIENSPIDWYWGCGKDGTGKNVLGQILMEVREELKGE